MPAIPFYPQLPAWLKTPLPLSSSVCAFAGLFLLVFGTPLARFEMQWSDTLLKGRFWMGLTPHPDPRVFLVGFENKDFESTPNTGAEYQDYADLIRMTSDLGAAVMALDFILGRGGPREAEPVIASARGSRGVVLAAAAVGGTEGILRAFPFDPPEFPYGLVNTPTDPDGVHRSYQYAWSDGRTCHPSLALAQYLLWQNSLADLQCKTDGKISWSELADDKSTLVQKQMNRVALINFRSKFIEPWDRGFKYASFTDLRKKYADWRRAGLKTVPGGIPGPGSLVVAGAVGSGLGDIGSTPFGSNEPLFMIHAAALNDLVQAESLQGPSEVQAALIAIGLAILFIPATLRVRKLKWLVLSWIGMLGLLVVTGIAALTRYQFIFPAITPAVLVTLLFLTEAGRRYGLVSLEKLQLRLNLGMYFSPRVLEAVIANPGIMEPREAELTVLLTDLRNFTTCTEQMGTAVMFDLLNRIFEIETKAVMAVDGSMEHFLGDQFLGYWGAPGEQPDAADCALRASDEIIRGLNELRSTLAPDLAALFGFGLAIHKGKALIGNKGSSYRLDYGILGDIVNGAARLESLTKVYGVQRIVTREVLNSLGSMPAYRLIDRAVVKGKAQPLEMFEVFSEDSPARVDLRNRYAAAFRIYEEGAFEEAGAQFDQLASDYGDGPSKALASRSRELCKDCLQSWDGCYRFKDK